MVSICTVNILSGNMCQDSDQLCIEDEANLCGSFQLIPQQIIHKSTYLAIQSTYLSNLLSPLES